MNPTANCARGPGDSGGRGFYYSTRQSPSSPPPIILARTAFVLVARLQRRLSRIDTWAEKQGLELAADCHLARITQAAHLLHAPKSVHDDIASISR